MALSTISIDISPWNIRFDTDNEAFDFIRGIDENIATVEFTRRIYEYARDILTSEGEEV